MILILFDAEFNSAQTVSTHFLCIDQFCVIKNLIKGQAKKKKYRF
jgi:hypothetical protein